MRAIGNPVAFDASADDRETRGVISITSISPSAGFTANWVLHPPAAPPGGGGGGPRGFPPPPPPPGGPAVSSRSPAFPRPRGSPRTGCCPRRPRRRSRG